MLSTDFLVLLGVIAAIAVVFQWQIIRIYRFCRRSIDFVENSNKRSLSLRRMAEVEATLTELSDAYDALLKSHKKLRSRIGMRENRARRANGAKDDDIPDAKTDPDGWKRAMRLKLRREGVLR